MGLWIKRTLCALAGSGIALLTVRAREADCRGKQAMQVLKFCHLVLGMLLVLTFGSVATHNAFGQDKVRLADTTTLYSVPVFVALEKNYFEPLGLEIDRQPFARGKLALDALLAGASDIAMTAESPITAAVMAQRPIALVARVAKIYPTLLVHPEAGIKELDDLRGKRIAFTSGSGNEIYTYAVLHQAGIEPGAVTFVNLRLADMPAALMNRSVDAITGWQPFIASAQRLIGGRGIVLETPGVYTETWNVVVMQDYLESNSEVVGRFLQGLLDAEAFMQENKGEAVEIASKAIDLDPAVVEMSFADFEFRIAIDGALLETLETHTRWRLDTGNHPEGMTEMPNFRQVLVAPDVLRSIAPDRVSLEE